jgi:hypothetical protein
MDRIAVVAAALLLLGGTSTAQQGARPPSSRVEADGIPEETKAALSSFVLNAQGHLASPEFGLKPPEPAQFWLRIRTPKRNDGIFPGPMIYTAGTAALTLYAHSAAESLNGGGAFDPCFSVLDAVAETGWATRIRAFWHLPAAVRFGLDRHFSQRLLEVLEKEAEKDKGAPRWPGSATPRKGSLESLPPDHPLVADRDRVVDLLDRFAKEPNGQKELLRILTFCSDNQISGSKMLGFLTNLLAPLLADGPKSLLPEVSFATREPWPGPGKNPLAMRMNGLGGDASPTAIQLRLAYGEQRTTPTEFEDWHAGGAPTLLFHSPQAGEWSLTGVEICCRRTAGEKDDAANRLFWIVLLDDSFHELFRWPFLQTAIPLEKAAWVRLPISSPPEFPPAFWFLALDAGDPGPGAKLEICVRPGAAGEHCFRSVPNRKVSGLAAPVDYAVYVDSSGRALEPGMTPAIILDTLKRWCKPK